MTIQKVLQAAVKGKIPVCKQGAVLKTPGRVIDILLETVYNILLLEN